jgi:hypothetical protein
VDLVITNLGDAGANTLELTARYGSNADWLSVSTNSNWDCQQFGIELRCTRDTLIEFSDSVFSVLVDSNSASLDELKVRVESRTLDIDLSNNVFNDEIVETTETSGSENSTPVDGSNNAAGNTNNNEADNTNNNDTDAGSDTTGTGTDSTTTTGDNSNNDSNANAGLPEIAAANEAPKSGGSLSIWLLMLLVAGRALRVNAGHQRD